MRKCYALMAMLAVLALGLFAGAALAGNGKPPAPPGQGECAHGNSGKPCKEDPQPEKGKDCEEHGKKGGVNEDHCKGTTPPPPTTTEEEPPSTTTTTETTPTEQTTTTPTSVPDTTEPSTVPGQTGKPVDKPTLEKQLEEQAERNGAPQAGATTADAKGIASDTLPYTGFETWMAVLIGLGLSGIGIALRRWAK